MGAKVEGVYFLRVRRYGGRFAWAYPPPIGEWLIYGKIQRQTGRWTRPHTQIMGIETMSADFHQIIASWGHSLTYLLTYLLVTTNTAGERRAIGLLARDPLSTGVVASQFVTHSRVDRAVTHQISVQNVRQLAALIWNAGIVILCVIIITACKWFIGAQVASVVVYAREFKNREVAQLLKTM